MEKVLPYAETVDIKDKEEIWRLYFGKMYSYEQLEKHFKGKYKYSQLKSIIVERIRMG